MGSKCPEAAPKSKQARILIACIRCKTRKIRCDGGTPGCNECVAGGAECSYSPTRRYRGPARRKHAKDGAQLSNRGSIVLFSPEEQPENGAQAEVNPKGSHTTSEQTQPLEAFFLHIPSHLRSRVHRLRYLDYLLVYGRRLETWRADTDAKDGTTARIFGPLMPRVVALPLVRNCFDEMMKEYQLLTLAEIEMLLEAQYAASATEPAGEYTRWAIINTIAALAVRAKAAPGSEAEFSHITDTLYRNATIVLPEIILQEPSELSIQALLAMAMFAIGTPDPKACLLLASNASRHLDLVTLTPNLSGSEKYVRLYVIANALENAAGMACRMPESKVFYGDWNLSAHK